MKKVLKVLVIIVIVIVLGIDFYGLWKYKLSGKQYVIEAESDEDYATEEPQEKIVYEEITSATLVDGKVLFIKNIEESGETYTVKGVIYAPCEISKEDYDDLKAGESVEILGTEYTKNRVKSNSMTLKSTESSAKDYYISYDKKYILKDSETDYTIYKSTEKNVKVEVAKETSFVTVKNGKTTTAKIDSVVEKHTDLTEPDGETGSINTCELTFNKDGECTKIKETIR